MDHNSKVGAVLIIGAGIAGIQAALDISDLGFYVYLIDTRPNIGGKMAQLDKTYPTNDCSICILAPKIVEVARDPNIKIITNSEVKKVTGDPGNFQIIIEKKPRYVDELKCIGCGKCSEVCPIKIKFSDKTIIDYDFDYRNNWKLLQFDLKKCIGCGNCVAVCPNNYYYPNKSNLNQIKFDDKIIKILKGKINQKNPCLQCIDAPCVNACKDNILIRDENNILKLAFNEEKNKRKKLSLLNRCKKCIDKPCIEACHLDNIKLLDLMDQSTLIPIKCDQCSGDPECARVCPTNAITYSKIESHILKKDERYSDFNEGLGTRSAIYIPSKQTVPNVYIIDKEHCISFNTEGKSCGSCVQVCESDAINFDQKSTEYEINVGAIVISTGYEIIEPGEINSFYNYQNIITSLQYERLICASGPTNGLIIRPSDKKHPKRIAFLSCVGSRNPVKGVPYCSGICCMYLAKEAILTKEHNSKIECYIFKNDLRTFGKGFNEYVTRAQKYYGVKYIQGQVGNIEEDPNTKNLILMYEDIDKGISQEMDVDLVVSSTPIIPSSQNEILGKVFGMSLDVYGFFSELHKYNPLRQMKYGVFTCGNAQGPKNIQQSVADASATASRVSSFLHSERGTLTIAKKYPIREKIVSVDDEPRIGVIICHCGTNIGGYLDSDAVSRYVKNLPNVLFSESVLYACNPITQQLIKNKIQELDLNRFLVASCTPRTHEALFAETCKEAGLNPYLFHFVNIREQCSWVHMHDPENATEKAKDLVRMGVAKARKLEPLKKGKITIIPKALVIGGGISGMMSAIDIADQGFEVHLVNKERSLGGILKEVNLLYPFDEDAIDFVHQFHTRVETHPKIIVYNQSIIKDVSGYIGNFHIQIQNKNKSHEVKVGIIIVATGATEYEPELCNKSDKIITNLELEQMIIKNPEILKKLKNISFIFCYDAKQENKIPYCSKTCCEHAIKNINLLKELNQDLEIMVLYRDIQMAGKYNEEFYRYSRRNAHFLRYDVNHMPKIQINAKNIELKGHNKLLQEDFSYSCDLLVLVTPMIPNQSNNDLSKMLKVPLNKEQFFLEAHVKLRPLDFANDGIFLCGTSSFPKDFMECLSQASGAAGRALRFLTKKFTYSEGITSIINSEKCIGCEECISICPYNAIELESDLIMALGEHKFVSNKAKINEVLCKGCGTCIPKCPVRAINQKHFRNEEIIVMIDELFNRIQD